MTDANKLLVKIEHDRKIAYAKEELSRYYKDQLLIDMTDHWMNYFEISNKDIRNYEFIEYHKYNQYERKTEMFLGWKLRAAS